MEHAVTTHLGARTGMTFTSCSCGWNLHGKDPAQMAQIGADHYVKQVGA